jgi:hypothetical protein
MLCDNLRVVVVMLIAYVVSISNSERKEDRDFAFLGKKFFKISYYLHVVVGANLSFRFQGFVGKHVISRKCHVHQLHG